MPALTTPSAAPKGKAIPQSKAQPGKKTRTVRRRGRGAGLDSDEEIEREVGSDTDSDTRSSLASDDEDGGSDPENTDAARVVTPSTTQSPPPPEGDALKTGQNEAAAGPFQQTSADWSEMVAAEDANGAGDLPVIDFADLGKGPEVTTATQAVPAASSPTPPNDTAVEDDSVSTAGPSKHVDVPPGPRRPYGQNARLAYQERLDKDPSYVPVIGQFWGHDDRLLDKEVRPLSTWWRARGFTRGGFRGRGRGGFFGPERPPFGQNAPDASGQPVEVPPVDKAWTHDGFEEMKRRDEHRRNDRGRGGFRGGRGGSGPGRGGYASPLQRESSSSASIAPSVTPAAPANWAQSVAPAEQRGRYETKPERPFTKQNEGLSGAVQNDHVGADLSYTVRLPGGSGSIVGGSSQPTRVAPSRGKGQTPDPEMMVVVRLPSRVKSKASEAQRSTAAASQSFATISTEDSVEFITDPAVGAALRAQVTAEAAMLPSTAPLASASTVVPSVEAAGDRVPIEVKLPAHGLAQGPMPKMNVNTPHTETAAAEPSTTTSILQVDTGIAPTPGPVSAMHAGAPVFSPASHQPQSSPYGSYPSSLPPGIALSQHGVPYEVSTGRPVFIPSGAPPPPSVPQQMYTPPPGMHGPPSAGQHPPPPPMPFVPGHMHHHSSLSMGPTPPPEFFAPLARPPSITTAIDPATGLPIFTPARQSSRIQIRAPGVSSGSPANTSSPAQSSALRMSVGPPVELAPASVAEATAPPPLSAVDLHAPQFAMSAPGTAPPPSAQPLYAPYPQQPYFYPGYQPYMGHREIPSYDMYPPPDHLPPQQTVYYHH
jgi:hypothetical protein